MQLGINAFKQHKKKSNNSSNIKKPFLPIAPDKNRITPTQNQIEGTQKKKALSKTQQRQYQRRFHSRCSVSKPSCRLAEFQNINSVPSASSSYSTVSRTMSESLIIPCCACVWRNWRICLVRSLFLSDLLRASSLFFSSAFSASILDTRSVSSLIMASLTVG